MAAAMQPWLRPLSTGVVAETVSSLASPELAVVLKSQTAADAVLLPYRHVVAVHQVNRLVARPLLMARPLLVARPLLAAAI